MMRRPKAEKIGWHVLARGARRLELFHDLQDYDRFLSILKYSLSNSNTLLWAFTLMSNHYHLVLYASTEEVTACMRRLDTMYSHYHNERYGLVGHAFDGPYRSYWQPSSFLLLRTIAYVFLNPVSAFIAKDPGEYAWSCCRQFLDLPGSPMEADLNSLMQWVGPDAETAWSLFHAAMKREARRPPKPVTDRLSMTAVHAQQFEWLLEYARERQDHFSGESPELVAIYWARQYGIAPRSIATVLEFPSTRMISDALYQLSLRIKSDPDLLKLLAPP